MNQSVEELAHEMKQVATEESELQSGLFQKWQETLVHKNGIEVLKMLSEKMRSLCEDLEAQQETFRDICLKIEQGKEAEGQDEDKMLRNMVGSYVWIFRISESICGNAGRQLYDLIENDELHERIVAFEKKPKVEN
jgi:hypothetical protein